MYRREGSQSCFKPKSVSTVTGTERVFQGWWLLEKSDEVHCFSHRSEVAGALAGLCGFGLLSVARRSVWSGNSENFWKPAHTSLFGEKDRYRNQLICSKKSGRFYISWANSAHWERKKRISELRLPTACPPCLMLESQEFCGIPQWKFFYRPHDRWSPSVL